MVYASCLASDGLLATCGILWLVAAHCVLFGYKSVSVSKCPLCIKIALMPDQGPPQ